jgi:hypothetical protein
VGVDRLTDFAISPISVRARVDVDSTRVEMQFFPESVNLSLPLLVFALQSDAPIDPLALDPLAVDHVVFGGESHR